MRRFLKWTAGVLLGAFAALLLLTILTARPGDANLYPPKPGAPRVTLNIVSHGYHAGIILPRAEIARISGRDGLTGLLSVAIRFESYDNLEIGWGDENFYRHVPYVSFSTLPHVLRALFGFNNASVLHVVGFNGPPRGVFPSAPMLAIDVGEEGFAKLLDRIDASIGRDAIGGAVFLGPGLYGPSLFARAEGAFNLTSVCNHWIASLLNAAGIPVAPVPATLPAGLFADLLWRSGAREMRAGPLPLSP